MEPTSPTLPAAPNAPTQAQRGIGIVAPYDFALDRELWQWVPPQVSLHLTRTPHQQVEVNLTQAELIGAPGVIARCAVDLSTIGPEAIAYACTSGSFVGGPGGQSAIIEALNRVGYRRALTTSGAIVAALHALGAHRVAVATPYDEPMAAALSQFLTSNSFTVTNSSSLGLSGRIWTVEPDVTADLIRRTARDGTQAPDAVVVSCTNLPTRDLIAPLEIELGIPIVTANQATLWLALHAIGLRAVGAGQALLHCKPEVRYD